MNKFVCAGIVALALTFTPMVFAAEKLSELDASGGGSHGEWVIFVSKGMAPNAPMGTTVVAVGKGDTVEAAFGMTMAAGKATAMAVKEDVIKEARSNEKDPPAVTVKVKVTAAQHDAVKKIVEEWSAVKKHEDPANDVAVNFAQKVLDALKMKRPYRTGLIPVNPVQYYADVAVVNRKLGKATT